MKKKIGIGIGILLAIIVVVVAARTLLFSKNKVAQEEEDIYGIEYYRVPDMEQVFVNGMVKPEESEEFHKEEELGTPGDIQVKNGESVIKNRLLYTYENKEVTKQINDLKNQISRMETQKANSQYKLNLAVKNWNNQAVEERTQTLEEIKMDMSTSDIDAEIKELNSNIKSLNGEHYKQILAPFSGKVYIPEVKNAESAMLKLISDNFYVSGTVNERDVSKLAPGQVADIKVISNDKTVTGKVDFIDLNPAEETSELGGMGEDSSTMSSYPVKVSLNSLEGIRNGYHVQAVINIGKSEVTIPTESIHKEKNQVYVLVNDFGTVVRRVIQIGKEQGEKTVVTSGLEAEDQIIISSKKPIKEGQILSSSEEIGDEPIDGQNDEQIKEKE